MTNAELERAIAKRLLNAWVKASINRTNNYKTRDTGQCFAAVAREAMAMMERVAFNDRQRPYETSEDNIDLTPALDQPGEEKK